VLLTVSPAVFSADNAYLEIAVGGETLTPRQQIVSVGYAVRAAKADNAVTSNDAAAHIAADGDLSATNEIQNIVAGTGLSGGGNEYRSSILDYIADYGLYLQQSDIELYKPTDDDYMSGITIESEEFVEDCNPCELVCLGSDGYLRKAKSDSINTMPALFLTRDVVMSGWNGMAILTMGLVKHSSWSWTPNTPLYVSSGIAGAITNEVPTATGHIAQKIGYAIQSGIIYFRPDLTLVEVKE
jgi:hypothetical protein